MKKTKLAIGLMTAMLTAGALVGCDNTVKYADDGKIITYKLKDDDSDPTVIKADDLLDDYYKDSSKFQSIFDAINSIVVRNYFESDMETVDVISRDKHNNIIKTPKTLGKSQMPEIEEKAKKDVNQDKITAQENAENNNTKYADEFQNILSSNGVKSEEELLEKYIDKYKKSTFEDNFYTYHMKEIKNGDETVKYDDDKVLWTGYFADMVPYHVSHILVKVEDGSGTNYANGTISANNAEKLYKLVNELSEKKENKDSFYMIASRYSDDGGSGEEYGNLDMLEYTTGYVNEFKLGVYAYENFFGENISAVRESNIGIPGNNGTLVPEDDSISENFLNASKKAFGDVIPEIPFKVFEDLYKVRNDDKDANGKPVIDGSANFFPRNIIYNKFLNRHSIALITVPNEDDHILSTEEMEKWGTGFIKMNVGGTDKNVLSVKTDSGKWTPILCVRAGADYQGIHFIVVNRSKFEQNDKVSLDEYYTTYYPEQAAYPLDENGNPKATYVNFNVNIQPVDTTTRAGNLISKFKTYDTERLNRYIFKLYFEKEGVQLNSDALKEVLDKWIGRGLEKKEQEKEEEWVKTWNDYINTLEKQNEEREKLVSDACRIAFLKGNGLDGSRNDVFVSDMLEELATAMRDAGEIDPNTGEVFTVENAKKYIKSIRIGSKTKEGAIKDDDLISVLFKKEGALCNDGKEH